MKPFRTSGLNVVENLGLAHQLSLPNGPERTAICVEPLPGGNSMSLSVDILNALDRRSWSRALTHQKADPEKRAALWLWSAEIQNVFIPNADWMNEDQLQCAARLSEICAVWLLFAQSSAGELPVEIEVKMRDAAEIDAHTGPRLERASLALSSKWEDFPEVPACGPLEFRGVCSDRLSGAQLKLVDQTMTVGGAIAKRAIARGEGEQAVEAELLALGDERWKSTAVVRGAQLAALSEGWRLGFDFEAWEARWTGGPEFAPHEMEMLCSLYEPFVLGMYVLMRSADLTIGALRNLKCRDLTFDGGRPVVAWMPLELDSELVPIIKALAATQVEGFDPDAPLFRSIHGNEMQPRGIRQRLDAFCEKTALPRPRSLRAQRSSDWVAVVTEFRPLRREAA